MLPPWGEVHTRFISLSVDVERNASGLSRLLRERELAPLDEEGEVELRRLARDLEATGRVIAELARGLLGHL